jgi:hypothetical protein
MAASQVAQPEIVQFLLAQGADMHARGENYRTALFYASSAGCAHCVHILLAHGADVNCLDVKHMTPLMAAVSAGDHANVCQMLCRAGVNLNTVDVDGFSALIVAILYRTPRIVALLCEFQPSLEIYIPNHVVPASSVISTTGNYSRNHFRNDIVAGSATSTISGTGTRNSIDTKRDYELSSWHRFVEDRGDEDVSQIVQKYYHSYYASYSSHSEDTNIDEEYDEEDDLGAMCHIS